MKSHLFIMAFILSAAVTFSPRVHADAQAKLGWLAGVAKLDITPTEPIWLAGYASRDHESEGVLIPIFVKALALRDAEDHVGVMVSCDVLGFPKDVSDRIRGRLKDKLKIEPAQIILNASHTHTAPVLSRSLWCMYPVNDAQRAKIDAYAARFEEGVVECVSRAFESMKPARLRAGCGMVRFAVNRRNNNEAAIRDAHELKGPTDHSAPVLSISDETNAPFALLFSYACHATTLNFYKVSGDYPGFAQAALEAEHPGLTAMFFAGCGADQNPLPRRSEALARQYGRELASAADCALEDPVTELEPTLKIESAEIELALSDPPTRDQLVASAQASGDYNKRAIEDFIKQIDEGKPLPTTYPYPIQMWRLGNRVIIALGGEVVVDYAIAIKQMLGNDAIVFGYSNDLMGYIPSERVLHEGGYEGGKAQMLYGLPAPWKDDIETKIMTAVRDLATKLEIPLK
jgi:hypothetical protein